MELTWRTSPDQSVYHAAHSLAEGHRLIDEGLQGALQPAVKQLIDTVRACSIHSDAFWKQLLSLAVDYSSTHELSERIFKRTEPGSATSDRVSRLSAALSTCRSIFRAHCPKLDTELPLRVGPLLALWEARGPGLLYMVKAQTEPEFLAEHATVILVQPVRGGAGSAHLDTNRVHIEALLTDVDFRLPESLRLAWLLSQLQLDRPQYGDQVPGHRLQFIASRALIPILLSASEEVQLSRCTTDMTELALRLWLHQSQDMATAQAAPLLAWWETQREGRYPWATALSALNQMMTDGSWGDS